MKWTFFPKTKSINDDLLKLIYVFETNLVNINSESNELVSDEVLTVVSKDLEQIGYCVEKSKKKDDKIKIPVLYGESGKIELAFDVDGYNPQKGIVIEVEAGRAVTNYQFLKDFFEACCMEKAEYLCIAVREKYKKSPDYKKVCRFFNTMYDSNRFLIPLKGILVIGY